MHCSFQVFQVYSDPILYFQGYRNWLYVDYADNVT